jgi:hypothetical protein
MPIFTEDCRTWLLEAAGDPPEDVTKSVIDSLEYAPKPAYFRDIDSAKTLTPARKRVLRQLDGTELGYVSNAVLYDPGLRHLKKSDHKILISLIKGGFMRVLRVSGPLPGEHPPSRIGAQADYHYVLKAR